MLDNLPLILSSLAAGVPPTVFAAVGGIALTIALSAVAGLALLSRHRAVRAVSRVYVEFFRGTSEVVQLFWIFFVLPALVGYQIVPLAAGIVVLGLNHGAYGAEIVRGAVRSVPRAQYDACTALSLSPWDRMRRVVLPQAVVEMLPSFTNLFIQLLKSTALLSLVVVDEIVRRGQLLVPNLGVGEKLTIYLVELLLYLGLAVLVTSGMRLLERRAAARVGRPPTAARSGFATGVAM
ncbi:ectoine/hydroxyectoine ABC transporter permease subunit EhuC [Pseudonocardia lacus]|uniref:ectoine/hydroxyectoine ABC transporter permease subunit EhuC n=1 Tax=Pseudonocardia lacus TaxID=2835865 RepID=UPI001BDCFDBB|nr:ectoine/hydroxyectoine ABC transporter permease subunit EhuC [Pseudonocardia lacus]